MAARTKTTARKRPLSAPRIAAAAMQLIDAKGLEGFSFRVLAKKLNCEAMSLYHYFPSKAHLYDALVEICLAEMPVPGPELPWLERLRAVCHAMRATALRHPGFFLYFAIHRLNNRAGLTFLNAVLEIFDEIGLPAEASARHFRAVGYYLMGAGLDEAMGYGRGPSAVEPVPADVAAKQFPAITARGKFFAEGYREAIFTQGLEVLLAAIVKEAEANARRLSASAW